MNPMQLLGMKKDVEKFKDNHPRFIQFVQAMAQDGLREGTIVECKVITPEGREVQTNLKITADDLELIQKLKGMM